MNRQQKTIVVLVAVTAVLATLVVMEVVGRPSAYAQGTASQAGFVTVVTGPLYRNRSIPIVLVDSQQLAIMTYEYTVAGTQPDLTLTNVRSFRYDRRLSDYHIGQHRRPWEPPSHNNANSVEEIRVASQRIRPLE